MKRDFRSLHEKLMTALQGEEQEPKIIHRCLNSMAHIEKAISEMKAMVLAEPFLDKQEEIHHFRNEAPEIYSHLFFFKKLLDIESIRAYTSPDKFRDKLGQEKEALGSFFNQHDTICRYYGSGSMHMDDYLFLRRKTGEWIVLDPAPGTYIPDDFTIGAYWFSWIKANIRYQDWLIAQLGGVVRHPKLQWKGKRIEFIETFTALFLEGCFGDVTLKEVMEWGEGVLGVKVGQYHVALYEISTRKESLTMFLDRLTGGLITKIKSLVDKKKNQ